MLATLEFHLPKLKFGLKMLLEAIDLARDGCADEWQFAISLDELRQVGLSDNLLRWLIAKEYVQHRVEISRDRDSNRVFSKPAMFVFRPSSCFLLTAAGMEFAHTLDRRPECATVIPISTAHVPSIPHWNEGRRELSYGGVVVKRFRNHAPHQRLILSAFEEEGWPQRIDDPLPPLQGGHDRQRLHDAITCLNRCQLEQRIHFGGDGTGSGVCWEPLLNGNGSGSLADSVVTRSPPDRR